MGTEASASTLPGEALQQNCSMLQNLSFATIVRREHEDPSSRWPHQIPAKCPVELLNTYRHLHTVKGVLHHEVSIDLIASPNDKICISLLRACKQQELDSRRRLIACQSEMAGFKTFNTSGWWFPVPRWLECGRGWVDAPRDGVNTVERSCEDQVVVGVQLLETWGECPVVD